MYRISLFFIALFFVFSVSTASAQGSSNPLVELKNQYSGKCLAVKGASKEHGATLIHKECGTGSLDGLWEMGPGPKGYQIVNKNSGLCLGVAHQSNKDGEQVTQVSPCGRPDTAWRIEYLSAGSGVDYGKPIVIRNSNSNKCLALVTGDEIKQYGCPPHRPKTTWQFAPFKAPTVYKRVFVTSGTYKADFLARTGGTVKGADDICQDIAAKSGLPGTYRAWISVYDHAKCEGMRMADRGLSANDGASAMPFVNVCNGKPVNIARNFSALVSGSLANPISCTEQGVGFSGTPGVWTGTRTDGRSAHYESCKQRKWASAEGKPCYVADSCWNYQAAARDMLNMKMRCLYDLKEMYKNDMIFCDGGVKKWYTSWEWDNQECWKILVNSEGLPIAERVRQYGGVSETDDDKRHSPWDSKAEGRMQESLQSLVGNAGTKDKNWTQYRWLSCSRDNAFRLYCFEQ